MSILTWTQPVKDSETNWPMVNWQNHYTYEPISRGVAKLSLGAECMCIWMIDWYVQSLAAANPSAWMLMAPDFSPIEATYQYYLTPPPVFYPTNMSSLMTVAIMIRKSTVIPASFYGWLCVYSFFFQYHPLARFSIFMPALNWLI